MNKQEFKETAKEKIDTIFSKIYELESKRDLLKDNAVEIYDKGLSDLKDKKDELQAKYNEIENATEENWEEVKNNFTSATASFKESLLDLTKRLN